MPAPLDLHVVDTPSADPGAAVVVVVHGAMDRSSSFGRVARQLDDLHVVRYDRRGYGRSVGAPVGTLDDHVDDLLGVIDGRAVTVFGHSIGGVIALVAAQRDPGSIRSVLAYEAPSPWADWWPRPRTVPPDDSADEAEAFMRRAIGGHYWDRLPARTRSDRRSEGAALRADIASLQGTSPFEASAIEAPVLAACGSDTTWWHQRATRELADAVPGGEHAVVAGAEHAAHLTHPAATAHLVRRAAARAAGGTPDHRR
ncbi:MAG TPA: alpha/beta fold hydrolase [Acidimicrobiales bacterium]|nr:alpha/beta fold hydrolase [Acidimicrobiales bacterium]